MIFNTAWFLGFFLLFYALFWVMPGPKARFFFVLAASAFFHGHFAGPAGVLPIVVMAVVVYAVALQLAAATGDKRPAWYRLGLFVPVAGLFYYKYRVLLLGSLIGVLPALKGGLGALAAPGPLPLAVSFFTFEFVHYLTDVLHGKEPIRSPWTFGLFCIYFPSIVSGPIKRYEDFSAQVEHGIALPKGWDEPARGFARVLLGFFKKMVIADNVTTLIGLMEAKEHWGPQHVLLLMALLCIRILFDFSGYSDIAIGLARMMGLRLPENFNWPYAAANIQDFWRRWHMSLSSWIRDYVYIPLGGSRQGGPRKVANGLFAMALCGLWHGAAWNFLVWGVYHGCGLALHGAWRTRFKPAESGLAWAAAWSLNMAFVAYGWLLFFYPMDKVLIYTKILCGAQ